MILTIIIISLSMAWLGYETKWFTIRLLIGKVKSNQKDDWTPYYKELLARDNRPYNTPRTMAEWEIYNKQHPEEIEHARLEREREQEEYRKAVELRESHTCHICDKYLESITIETHEIKAGNSVCHVRGCPDCLNKWQKEIERSQTEKIKQPVIKSNQLPLFEYKHRQRTGSHVEYTRWNSETNELEKLDKYKKGYHRNVVEEYETVYHDCLVSKEWLKEHENFEYPEPTIDIQINDKSLHVNGNYKKGLIGDFLSVYTERVKAGKKTLTVVKGGHVVNMGGGAYVAVNGETKNGEYQYF